MQSDTPSWEVIGDNKLSDQAIEALARLLIEDITNKNGSRFDQNRCQSSQQGTKKERKMSENNLTDKAKAGQANLKNASEILAIRRVEYAARFKFFVILSDDGDSLEIQVSASELQSYLKFQKAILERHGCYFRNDFFEEKRGRGADNWANEIENHFRSVEMK